MDDVCGVINCLSFFSLTIQLLGFMYSWLTFYHQGHEVATDYKPYMVDLQKRIQNVSLY